MSRGIKDLREIICISRLSVRDDDDDSSSCISSDEVTSNADLDIADISLDAEDRRDPDGMRATSSGGSADSGCYPSRSIGPGKKNKIGDKKSKLGHSITASSKVLSPPVLVKSVPSKLTEEWRDVLSPLPSTHKAGSNLDPMMTYLDTNSVAEWLSQANIMIQALTQWFSEENHFVDFTHFWLSEFPWEQKLSIIRLEFSVLMDQLQLAFKVGLTSKALTSTDLHVLLKAILREYPHRLLNSTVNYLVLNYVDILTSGRSDEYRRLLTNVKLSTRNKTYVQWYLALRSFGLISMLHSLVQFYQRLADQGDVTPVTQRMMKSHFVENQENRKWTLRTIIALSSNSLPSIKYFIEQDKVSPSSFVDSAGRNLLYLAVSLQKQSILEYLLSQSKTWRLDVNATAENGNTPLHCAVAVNNLLCCELLLDNAAQINVNATNAANGHTTPLHVAVMNESHEIVQYLVSKGASIHQRNDDGLSPLSLAQALELEDIVTLLNNSQK